MKHLPALLACAIFISSSQAYWLMAIKSTLTVQRIDPVVQPGEVSNHAHHVLGGSNFGFQLTTDKLLKSTCTSTPIKEDKSAYWFPQLYFQWANGTFTSVTSGSVIYYKFPDRPSGVKAFPPDFRMVSGNPVLRSYNGNDVRQQAIDFLCLDFASGNSPKHTQFPRQHCKSGTRSNIVFPSCWDGRNVDSADHRSHVAFPSGGPESGTCNDPRYPVQLPGILLETYWATDVFERDRSKAKDPNQPFVFAHGDPTGYGNHADFFNGWEPGVLQRAVDGCNCDMWGDFSCCAAKGIFTMDKEKKCLITPSIDEPTTGTLPRLPGNNPVQPAGTNAVIHKATSTPAIRAPVKVYHNGEPWDVPPAPGPIVIPAGTAKPDLSGLQ